MPESLADIKYEMSGPGLCLGCKERLEWLNEQAVLDAQIAEDRRDVCSLAYQLLQRADWALIDTETTSLAGVVCEIAVVVGDGSILFHSLVNPEYPVSDDARDIHGISDEELAAAPTLPEIWPQLQEALRDRTILVAYNAAFDQARLAQSARRYHLQDLVQEWECAMEAYAAFCGNWSDYHGRYTWIPLVGGHRAVGDALAALERVREMAAVYEREYAMLPAEGGISQGEGDGKKHEERAGFQVESEHLARRVSSTTIAHQRNRPGGDLSCSIGVNSDGQRAALWAW